MNRSKRAVCWMLVLLIPLVVCWAASCDEGKVKTKTTFKPKPIVDVATGAAVTDPTESGEAPAEDDAEPPDVKFDDKALEGDLKPMEIVRTWTAVDTRSTAAGQLRAVNEAIAALLGRLETSGWSEDVKGQVEAMQAQLSQYVEARKIGEVNASGVVDMLKELRAAAADLRALANDETGIAELSRSTQPGSVVACPEDNRGCQALAEIDNALENWEAVSGAAAGAATASDLRTRLRGIRDAFGVMGGASPTWLMEQARLIDDICDQIASNTKPINGTRRSFAEWHNKLGLVEENLQWALDHAGNSKNVSAVIFGLEMARDFKHDLEEMHE